MRKLTSLLFCLIATQLAGCILMLPVADFEASSPDGRVNVSNCMGMQSVIHEREGLRTYIRLYGGGGEGDPAWIRVVLIPATGSEIRIPNTTIRVKPLDERQEKVISLPPWQRSALRKSGRNALRDETVETRPPSGPLSGGITNDGPEYFHPNHPKGYFVHVMLNDLHAGGYRVTLPEMTVDGKTLTLAPMEFRRRVRLEWFVPLNC